MLDNQAGSEVQGFQEERRSRRTPDIDMTPMIDCVFLLIIFFMLATTFAPLPGIKVKLPPPGTPQKDKPKGLIMKISDPNPGERDGVMVLNGDIVDYQTAFARFMNATPEEKEMLIIQSGRSVLNGQVIRVMDFAKRAGIEKIGFAMVARQ